MRRTASVLTSLTAIIGTGLVAGPATATAATAYPCALPRTDAHHSEGLDTWNTSYARPVQSLDALMVFLSFPDWKPFVTPGELVADHFPATSDFFARASYGRFDLRLHPVRNWIEMPADSSAYGIQRDWDSGLRSAFLRDAVAAANPRVDFGDYDIVYLVADPDAPGVNSDATKVVNFDEPMQVDGSQVPRIVTVFERHPPDRHVLAHETGHVFDLPDLYHRPEEGNADWDTHVGDWDLMGSQFGLAPEPFGWHKWKLGWLGPRNVDCVRPGPGTSWHTLRPLSAPLEPWRGEGDTRLAVVRTGPFDAIAIEARAPMGNDSGLCRGGVLLYRVRADTASADGPIQVIDGHPDSRACVRNSVYPPLADAPLGVGESYASDDGGGLRVEVGEPAVDGGWGVKITREEGPVWPG
ncbi:M6 family metalloprotease domain-containing protein [Streptomyces armeniacus]|uniref:M6 family metalloprotease domain-containing protein n=1 Tax=Streptomyces armeniacus TaxID=83291 RepID=A0A345XWP5_9ACTN|nr:M6 family metalloprotease domain-containing protein [Streptomyces armeniacus]AXK36061.1 M6 family metalloprotease domain-containing protein [Streptomyces armeniacus]